MASGMGIVRSWTKFNLIEQLVSYVINGSGELQSLLNNV